MGYNYDKSRNKWMARATIDGKRVYIGRFNTEAEARAAYIARTNVCDEVTLGYENQTMKFNWPAILKDPIATLLKLTGVGRLKKNSKSNDRVL